MLFIFIIFTLFSIAGIWVTYIYKAKVMSSNSKISWHRLVNSNVYVILLKAGYEPWEIELTLNVKSELITCGVYKSPNKISISVPAGRNLADIRSHMGVMHLENPDVGLFFSAMDKPEEISKIFDLRTDVESYKEMLFYLETSLNRK